MRAARAATVDALIARLAPLSNARLILAKLMKLLNWLDAFAGITGTNLFHLLCSIALVLHWRIPYPSARALQRTT
jgi:hypothetical protein